MYSTKSITFGVVIALNVCLILVYFLYSDGQKLNASPILEDQVNKSEINSNRKFSIISINANGSDYYIFHLPITVMFWRQLGYEPIVFYITSPIANLNSLEKKVTSYLKEMQVKILYIETESFYELITTMVIRIFCGILPDYLVGDNDFIITSDIDLYPVKSSYYNVLNKTSIEQVNVWNAFCCGSFNYNNKSYEMYPMGHIGMKKSNWKKVMQLSDANILNGKFVLNKIDSYFGPNTTKPNGQINRGDSTWDLDQKYISIRIKLTNITVNKMEHQSIRMDRSQNDNLWKMYINNYKAVTDVHSYQDKQALLSWYVIRDLFKKVFNETQNDLLDRYFKEFLMMKLT